MWLGLRGLWRLRSDLAVEAAESLHDMVRHLILGTCVLCAAGYAVVAVAPWWPHLAPHLWMACACYGALCILSLGLLQRNLLAGEVLWLVGMAFSVALFAWLQRDPTIAVLLVLMPLLAALTIGWPAAVLAELSLAGVLYLPWPGRTALLAPSSSFAVVLLIAGAMGAVVGWGAARVLANMLLWTLRSWEQAHRTMNQARDSRAEMKQVQEDLVLANQELARLSDKLKQMWQIAQEARQAKAEFVANVSHELRTPLNMIIGFAELMTGAPRVYGRSLPPTLLADIGSIHANAQHLARLVDDILDLSQVEAGRMALSKSWSWLPDIISEAARDVGALYESKGLYVRTDIEADLPQVYCDATRIRQVILNLLSNAGRFMERGGACIRARREANEVVVSVTDTGPGIAPEDVSRLFQPFSQLDASIRRRQGGSGLGLAISKQFVEMHEGRMWVESQVGVGTTFFFSLPVELPLPSMAGAAGRYINSEAEFRMRTRRFKAPLPQSLPRCVVIEKDQALSRLVSRYIGDVQVETVGEAEEALDLLKRVPASAVLVNGFWHGDRTQLEKDLALLPDALPIVTCWFASDGLAAEELGIARYLPKPVTREQLLSAVDAVGREARTVLLVDDEPEVLRLFTRILYSAERGYRILRAPTGLRALHLMRSEQPDLVILDLAMPDMDGFQVLRQKAADPGIQRIPVIVTSAKGLSTDPMRTDRITVTSYGGLTSADLLACVRDVIGIAVDGQAGGPERRERSAG